MQTDILETSQYIKKITDIIVQLKNTGQRNIALDRLQLLLKQLEDAKIITKRHFTYARTSGPGYISETQGGYTVSVTDSSGNSMLDWFNTVNLLLSTLKKLVIVTLTDGTGNSVRLAPVLVNNGSTWSITGNRINTIGSFLENRDIFIEFDICEEGTHSFKLFVKHELIRFIFLWIICFISLKS